MAKYTITNQKELRRSFGEFCKEFGSNICESITEEDFLQELENPTF